MRNYRFILLVLSLFIAFRAEAAMVRVLEVRDGRTLVVDRAGKAESIRLAGVAITDEKGARALLEWALVGSWVSIEAKGGEYLVYRSPDAMFVNRELVARGWARATLPDIEPRQHVVVTYLGTLNPPAPSAATTAPKTTAPARGSGSGKSRRSQGSPSRRGRPRN